MKIVGHFIDQVVAPQIDGCDHGSKGVVLIAVTNQTYINGKVPDYWKYADLRLIWRNGGKHWSSFGQQSYHPTTLQVLGGKSQEYWGTMPRDVFRGGRFSTRRITDALPKIRELMKGLPIEIGHINRKKTFHIDRVEA